MFDFLQQVVIHWMLIKGDPNNSMKLSNLSWKSEWLRVVLHVYGIRPIHIMVSMNVICDRCIGDKLVLWPLKLAYFPWTPQNKYQHCTYKKICSVNKCMSRFTELNLTSGKWMLLYNTPFYFLFSLLLKKSCTSYLHLKNLAQVVPDWVPHLSRKLQCRMCCKSSMVSPHFCIFPYSTTLTVIFPFIHNNYGEAVAKRLVN